MDWTERLARILEYHLFKIGGDPITPIDVLLFGCVLVLTFAAARSVRKLIEKRLVRVHPGARYTFARLAQYVTWVLGASFGLKILHIDLTALAVVAGALGVGIGFGLQNIVANFVSGLVLLFERPIEVGDRITIQDLEGNVRDINFRSTTIVTNDNITIVVPNSQFVNNEVTNWSHGDPRVRIHVPVGVAYGSDVAAVTEALLTVAGRTEGVLATPSPAVFFLEFGDSSLNFDLLVWMDDPAHHAQLRSRLNYGIDAEFRRRRIEIPFPQRDVHIRSAEGLAGAAPLEKPEIP
jgi:potassium efflux system protein